MCNAAAAGHYVELSHGFTKMFEILYSAKVRLHPEYRIQAASPHSIEDLDIVIFNK